MNEHLKLLRVSIFTCVGTRHRLNQVTYHTGLYINVVLASLKSQKFAFCYILFYFSATCGMDPKYTSRPVVFFFLKSHLINRIHYIITLFLFSPKYVFFILHKYSSSSLEFSQQFISLTLAHLLQVFFFLSLPFPVQNFGV